MKHEKPIGVYTQLPVTYAFTTTDCYIRNRKTENQEKK